MNLKLQMNLKLNTAMEAITNPSLRLHARLTKLSQANIPIQAHHPTFILQRLNELQSTILHKNEYKAELDATILALQSQSNTIQDSINSLSKEHHMLDRALWYQQLRDLNHPFTEKPQSPCGPEHMRQVAKPRVKLDSRDHAGFNAIADHLTPELLAKLKAMGYKLGKDQIK